MAKLEGDVWLSWRVMGCQVGWEMGGKVGGRWVAKLAGDVWLRWREMGG